jgi:hypothetical protein
VKPDDVEVDEGDPGRIEEVREEKETSTMERFIGGGYTV